MVEGDKVFALLPVTSNGFYAGDYLTDKHIPYFGFSFQPDYCGPERPFGFGVGGAISCAPLGDKTFVTSSSAAALIKATGVDAASQKVAIAGSADPASTTGVKVVELGFQATGATVVTVDNSLPAPTDPLPTDFTPFVGKLLDKQPTAIALVISFAQVEPMAKALRNAGFKGAIQQYVYENEGLAAVAANFQGTDGSYVNNPGVGSPVGDTKGLTDIRAGLDAIGFKTVGISPNVLYGWGSADMLIEMIKNTKGALTTENMVNTATKGWGYQGFQEAVCPSSWPISHYAGDPCTHEVQLDLTGANGATNSLGINGGKGGLLPKVSYIYGDLFITDKPK
jgi:branched-chain amino acid transport system substrate-binding protein